MQPFEGVAFRLKPRHKEQKGAVGPERGVFSRFAQQTPACHCGFFVNSKRKFGI